ncbi:araC family transcriptional regulator [Serratia marcescens]|nr:araC family transcriptional regulator [Serratia marcescens]
MSFTEPGRLPPYPPKNDAWKTLPLDEDLSATFYHVIESVEKQEISDIRLQYRLLDFLTALAERGMFLRICRWIAHHSACAP